MADWSQLPYELIVLIANQLIEIQDFLSFSAVSRSCRSVYLNIHWIPRQRPPLLMLGEVFERNVPKRKFFSLSTFKWYNLSLPEAHGCQCWGSSHGLMAIFDKSFTMRLRNPFTRFCIDLPPLSMLWNRSYTELDWFTAIQKTILFKLQDVFITFVIYMHHRSLAFCKPGDSKWTIIPFSVPVSISDVVCFKHQILAVTMVGTLMVIEIDGCESPRALFAASPPEDEKRWSNLYVVESSDNLLLVFRYEKGGRVTFKVYALDVLRRKWNKVDELGDRFLLVDDCGCASGSVYGYFKSNCIYYATDNLDSFLCYSHQHKVQQQMTVYNIKDNSTEVFLINDSSSCRYTCPAWMTPFW